MNGEGNDTAVEANETAADASHGRTGQAQGRPDQAQGRPGQAQERPGQAQGIPAANEPPGEGTAGDAAALVEQNAVKPAELSCPQCGVVVYPGEAFCENCGHQLIAGRPGNGAPRPSGGAECVGCGEAAVDAEGYCEHCGLKQPADRDHLEVEVRTPGGPVAGVSDRGKRYARNEDAFAIAPHPTGVAAVVCDGVGSSPRPETASRAAADTAATEIASALGAGATPADAVRTAVQAAATAVAELADSPEQAPSCTFVTAVTGPDGVTVGWVGDSRAYWLSADDLRADGADGGLADTGELNAAAMTAELAADDPNATTPDAETVPLGASRRLTDDDSWAAFMVASGALTEAEAEAHPNAHVITAWMGADAGEVRPHVRGFLPDRPGTLLVCSDGLWNYFPGAEDLAAVLRNAQADPAADPTGAARTLVRHALDAGGRDNITVAVLPMAAAPSTEQAR
ncbi:PP2C family serine/threonine-protein phosphatase [Actinomadura rupiterrae]|uniref:PP2C family serine/threonine-protein phosphatase n=1 Tax=Actinomadura rupiterrae TaxID=559627 RepID=UPI0020A4D98E|nr:protein phosphatase 2C domain-containing protein [Actinomadura rupiterrae]MCP2339676.1 serine/threonine protein phosphatase PrpC [Actinomadura rupiterrae]